MNYVLFGENNLHRLKNMTTDVSVAFFLLFAFQCISDRYNMLFSVMVMKDGNIHVMMLISIILNTAKIFC